MWDAELAREVIDVVAARDDGGNFDLNAKDSLVSVHVKFGDKSAADQSNSHFLHEIIPSETLNCEIDFNLAQRGKIPNIPSGLNRDRIRACSGRSDLPGAQRSGQGISVCKSNQGENGVAENARACSLRHELVVAVEPHIDAREIERAPVLDERPADECSIVHDICELKEVACVFADTAVGKFKYRKHGSNGFFHIAARIGFRARRQIRTEKKGHLALDNRGDEAGRIESRPGGMNMIFE
jgi:hypothetical protein